MRCLDKHSCVHSRCVVHEVMSEKYNHSVTGCMPLWQQVHWTPTSKPIKALPGPGQQLLYPQYKSQCPTLSRKISRWQLQPCPFQSIGTIASIDGASYRGGKTLGVGPGKPGVKIGV